jgi:cell division protein FtsL
MAEKKKKVATGKTPPKFQPKRRRSFSEKVFVVLGIIIALSMIVSLIVNFIPKAGF